MPRGERGVRIEFEAAEDSVVLSDFEMWHFVLNGIYIGETEEGDDSFDAELASMGMDQYSQKPLPDPEYRRRVEGSWDRVFDLGGGSNRCIQATLWEIPLSAVTDVKSFTAR